MSQERFQLLLFWKLSKTNEEIAFQITVPVIISPQIFLQFEMKILLRKPIDLLETVFSSNFFFSAKTSGLITASGQRIKSIIHIAKYSSLVFALVDEKYLKLVFTQLYLWNISLKITE